MTQFASYINCCNNWTNGTLLIFFFLMLTVLLRLVWKYPNKGSSYLDGDIYLTRQIWDELLYAILHTVNFHQLAQEALSKCIIYMSFINDLLLPCNEAMERTLKG